MHGRFAALIAIVALAVGLGSLLATDFAQAQYAPPAMGGATPGYNWREQRTQEDWRNKTWRQERAKSDWRNNTWREQRAKEDYRGRGDTYSTDKSKNIYTPGAAKNTDTTGASNPDCSEGSVATSVIPCR